MTTAHKVILGILALALVALGGFYVGSSTGPKAGLTSVGAYEALVKWFGNGIYVGTNQQLSIGPTGSISTTGTSTINSLASVVVPGTCNDATTTLFSIPNPYAGTSTVTLVSLIGQAGTTTIDILVGTSTGSGAPNFGNLATPSLINTTVIATSSQFVLYNGQTYGALAGDYVGNGNGRVVVGPNHNIVAQATSSYSGSSATGVGGITNPSNTLSCTYKVEFKQ